jgi:hypothetical protein
MCLTKFFLDLSMLSYFTRVTVGSTISKFQTINYISQMNEVELMECYNNNDKCKGKHFHELKL